MKQLLLLIFIILNVNLIKAQEDWKKKSTNEFIKQTNLNTDFSKEERNKVIEVFGDNSKKIVFDDPEFSKSIKHLLRNRIEVLKIEDPKKQKMTKLLSQVRLANFYNSSLKLDKNFDIDNFNPLKYNLEFFSKGSYIYRIDNTDYFIQILSQYK